MKEHHSIVKLFSSENLMEQLKVTDRRAAFEGGEGESVVFRKQILNHCFRELEVGDWSKWEHLLGSSIDWKDLAATIRLHQCQNEVEMPPWYYMTIR